MRAARQILLALTCLGALALVSCAPPGGTPKQGASGVQAYHVPASGGISAPTPTAALRTVRVGLLIPATGRNADLARALQDAATLALYDKYAALSPTQAATRVEILPKDTGDTPEQASAAAKAAIEDGAKILLGPVFATDVAPVAQVASSHGISLISFSNNEAAARPGAYVIGFTPDAQVARVMEYAVQQKLQIAALLPDSPLGQRALSVAKQTVSAGGSTLAPVGLYAPQGTGIDVAVAQMLSSSASFNALFVADTGAPLDTLLRTLAARGINRTNAQLLGTGLWDDPAFLSSRNLDGALIATSPPALSQGFTSRFKAAYGYTPPRIASLAYDAVALTVTLATTDRPFDADTLTQPGGFRGPANGLFRLLPSGKSERGLAILRISGGQLTTVVPAPETFR